MIANSKKGFVILYAVLLTMILLTVGIILLGIVTKQILLSTIEKGSQMAYYAADMGRQCAIYWDKTSLNNPPFGQVITDLDGTQKVEMPTNPTITCFPSHNSNIAIVTSYDADTLIYSSSFAIDLASSCARVKVVKQANPAPGEPQTKVISDGYNKACPNGNLGTVSKRTVQRTLQTSY